MYKSYCTLWCLRFATRSRHFCFQIIVDDIQIFNCLSQFEKPLYLLMRKIKEDLETVYENKHSFFMHREVIQNELILYEIRFFHNTRILHCALNTLNVNRLGKIFHSFSCNIYLITLCMIKSHNVFESGHMA